jgi:hypothetical protein
MSDVLVGVIVVAFGALTWGLLALSDWLLGGGTRLQ